MADPKTMTKGPELEELLKSYFWQAGYFALRSVPYRLDDEDVTDIDIWLYERPAASTRRRLIVDAKNKKSPRASERIIWTRGLQAALQVDGAVVATTDNRSGSRRLAKSVGILLLDGNAINKIRSSDLLKSSDQLSFDAFMADVRSLDAARRSVDWRATYDRARAGLVSGIGVQSVNLGLSSVVYFAENAVTSPRNSPTALLALRLLYSVSALTAISLDYFMADQLFRNPDERRLSLINGIRFGQSDNMPALNTVRAAVSLARKYSLNGGAIAKQIEKGFFEEAEQIPAEIIADYVARLSAADTLFTVARELERAALAFNAPSFDQLSPETKAMLGVFLDFCHVSREKIAEAWDGRKTSINASPQSEMPGPLFGSTNGS